MVCSNMEVFANNQVQSLLKENFLLIIVLVYD